MDDTAEFVEAFALELSQAGMQRMAARVFSALLAGPDDGLTAREIGDTLGVSAGAVSGATSYLTRTHLITRRRIPGERADRFDVLDSTWAEAMATETQIITALSRLLTAGLRTVEPESAAAARIAGTRDFFEFMRTELPRLVDRFHAERRAAEET